MGKSGAALRNAVLFVDDEEANLEVFRLHFESQFAMCTAKSGDEALSLLMRQDIAVVVTDERMPGMTGVELLARVAARWPLIGRVIVSAFSDATRLLGAINRGRADDYILKPFDRDELAACITRNLETARRARDLDARAERATMLERAECERFNAKQIVGGEDGGLGPTLVAAQRAAASDATVLLQGETGTGKELIARVIHECSPRRNQPFVCVNCGGLHEATLESELFGHERGAFTGAVATRRGRFDLADKGTIFLDEIGDVSPKMQVALLRVLQERTIERLGGEESIDIDVRIVAATHHDLRQLVAQERFREDLFYRLNVILVSIPPLRERRADIGPLVLHFVQRYTRGRPMAVSDDVIEALRQYDWPGNVRELENVVHRAVVMCAGEELTIDDFCLQLVPAVTATERDRARDEERDRMRQVLISNGFNCNRAAQALGMPRTTFMARAKKYGLI